MLLILTCSVVSFADENKGNNGAYCTPERQHELYVLLHENAEVKKDMEQIGYDVLEESIMPQYYLDIYDYANTGSLNVVALCKWKNDGTMDETLPSYYAKLVTKDNSLAGMIVFYANDNAVESAYMDYTNDIYKKIAPSDTMNAHQNPVSRSYADYAEYIKGVLKLNSFVPAENVKYVIVDGIRGTSFFYVFYNDRQVFVPVDSEIELGHSGEESFYDVSNGDFKALADRAAVEKAEWDKQYAEEYAKYQEEHPGEEFTLMGGGGLLTISFTKPQINDIKNIVNYLKTGVDEPVNNTPTTDENNTPTTDENNTPTIDDTYSFNYTPIIIISICVVAIIAIVFVVIFKKRSATK